MRKRMDKDPGCVVNAFVVAWCIAMSGFLLSLGFDIARHSGTMPILNIVGAVLCLLLAALYPVLIQLSD